MKLIFSGVQASGKGTQSELVAKKFGIPHISMGDLLRNYTGKYKKQIDETVKQGKLILVPWSIEIIKERISKPDCKKGFILDGFPRNLGQAEGLKKITDIDKVVEIVISDKEALRRLMGRRVCPKCGTSYNVVTEPKPKVDGICDKDGTKLIQRNDDNEESIKTRLKVYHEETEPIMDFYKGKVLKINGEQHIEKVQEEILGKLKD
ncbi:nucleoside monophosphate kinase [Candidatus Pacearchaeota archaeon]|nr:nucleoside monophosphate kinase [Candidatus Pacearchaeota archaeon]